jgi:hypothetical protein
VTQSSAEAEPGRRFPLLILSPRKTGGAIIICVAMMKPSKFFCYLYASNTR